MEEIAALAHAHPDAAVVVDEAYWRVHGLTCVPLLDDLPNLIVLRTLSKAFGLAALRVGYAVATPEWPPSWSAAASPASISAPAARIAAAALRDPQLDVEATVAERQRLRDALVAAGLDSPEARQLRLDPDGRAAGRAARGGRARRPDLPEDPHLAAPAAGERPRARGARSRWRPVPGRVALVSRTSTETALRIVLDLDGSGRSRVSTGIGFLDHLLTLWASMPASISSCSRRVTWTSTSTTRSRTCSPRSATHSARHSETAPASPGTDPRRCRWTSRWRRPPSTSCAGRTRRSSSPSPATGSAGSRRRSSPTRSSGSRCRRDHAPPRVLGADDHHVAEAAFKALGQALQQACAPGAAGVRSTKGLA